MTPLEELREALATCQGSTWQFAEWNVGPHEKYRRVVDDDGFIVTGAISGKESEHRFITLAHNLMPKLLEAVEMVGKSCRESEDV